MLGRRCQDALSRRGDRTQGARAKEGRAGREGGASVEAWWNTVLAGAAVGPHPRQGEGVGVRLVDGRLLLLGQVEDERDRAELIGQARARLGRGVNEVDATRLRVRDRRERRGILDQTLVAALPNRQAAELVREFVVEHARITPKVEAIVEPDRPDALGRLLPAELLPDTAKVLRGGLVLLVLRVDETDAFTVRTLLEEDTRSTWTVAAPPEPTRPGRS